MKKSDLKYTTRSLKYLKKNHTRTKFKTCKEAKAQSFGFGANEINFIFEY